MYLAPSVPVTVARMPLADYRQTVAAMRVLAREGSGNPEIRNAAVGVIFNTPPKSQQHEARALFEFVRDQVRYVRDPVSFESLASPDKTLALKWGDCDDQATLLAAMLESVGYPTRFVVAGYTAPQPEHVYLQVMIDGMWVDLDPTESLPFGFSPLDPLYLEIEGA